MYEYPKLITKKSELEIIVFSCLFIIKHKAMTLSLGRL